MVVFGLLGSFPFSSGFKRNRKSTVELATDFKGNL